MELVGSLRSSAAGRRERPATVLIAAEPRCAAWLRRVLRLAREFKVVAEATDGTDAVHLATACQPDVVMLDASMPVMSGLETIPALRARAPQAAVVMVATVDAAAAADRLSRRLGAHGCVIEGSPDDAVLGSLSTLVDRELVGRRSRRAATNPPR